MINQKIDTVVLGCTHYPFVIPLIQEIVGADVRVIDPAPAIARQVSRVLNDAGMRSDFIDTGNMDFYTSGDVIEFTKLLPRLLGETGLGIQGGVEKRQYSL